MARKRILQSSQSNPSSSAANAPPPAKRTRVEAPETAEPTQPTASTSTLPTLLVPETPDSRPQETLLLPPTKRKHHPGSLRRLLAPARSSIPFPSSKQPRTRPKATLSGGKIGGKSKDLKDGVVTEEMWINRGTKGNGLGFGGYLKKGVGAFVERGTWLGLCSGGYSGDTASPEHLVSLVRQPSALLEGFSSLPSTVSTHLNFHALPPGLFRYTANLLKA